MHAGFMDGFMAAWPFAWAGRMLVFGAGYHWEGRAECTFLYLLRHTVRHF